MIADDPFDIRRARRAGPLLDEFNDAGVLVPADVHVAQRLCALAGVTDPQVVLAAALAVRAPRLGHVYVDLATIRDTAIVDTEDPVDLSGLPWPEPAAWIAAVAASPLTAGPLRLDGGSLYLDRYWRDEDQLARELQALAAPVAIDELRLADGLARLFTPEDDLQQLAAAAAVLRRFAVVAGGPGTGKTTTVARIVALLAEQDPNVLVALAAPTAVAAQRLQNAVQEAAGTLDVAEPVRELLRSLRGVTLHRLLVKQPRSYSRFRHGRGNRLPHDVVIVDETSMVSLTMMARLVDAVRPQARLILVGDPGQLTSIEAGAVLSDVVGPAADGLRMRPAAAVQLSAVTGRFVDSTPTTAAIGDGIVVLQRVRRHGEEIAALARAVRAGDDRAVIDRLRDGKDVQWLDEPEPAIVRSGALETARNVIKAAEAGDAPGALQALGNFRVLCAHRRGPQGAADWQERIAGWLASEGFVAAGRWYAGRPLLVTQNDYTLRVFNGDIGVVVREPDGHLTAVFERPGEAMRVLPTRLAAVETVYAMTVHKAQGSQFGTAAVLLPETESPILTRELLYTAITRARDRLILVGGEEAIRAAVLKPVARASGLRARLWD